MEITFETLPRAVSGLYNKLENIEKLLQQKDEQKQQSTDVWFDLNQLCDYLPDRPVKPTVYGWVHNSLIPYHKSSKKLTFLKSEIDAWLKTGRKACKEEVACVQ